VSCALSADSVMRNEGRSDTNVSWCRRISENLELWPSTETLLSHAPDFLETKAGKLLPILPSQHPLLVTEEGNFLARRNLTYRDYANLNKETPTLLVIRLCRLRLCASPNLICVSNVRRNA
jgi:hypothetical protein